MTKLRGLAWPNACRPFKMCLTSFLRDVPTNIDVLSFSYAARHRRLPLGSVPTEPPVDKFSSAALLSVLPWPPQQPQARARYEMPQAPTISCAHLDIVTRSLIAWGNLMLRSTRDTINIIVLKRICVRLPSWLSTYARYRKEGDEATRSQCSRGLRVEQIVRCTRLGRQESHTQIRSRPMCTTEKRSSPL